MVLFGLLPLAALMLVIVAAFERTRNISTSVLLGGLGWALGLMLTTEVLSFVNAITFWVVLLAWILAIAVALSVIASGPLATRTIRPKPSAAASTGVERTITGVLLIIGGITLVIALNCPPNNFDSQTYPCRGSNTGYRITRSPSIRRASAASLRIRTWLRSPFCICAC
jgi:hypothetical protein